MGRLTKRSNKTSHENGVCCTHFMSKECVQFGGECAWGCKWEEAAWGKLADYEDAEEQGLLLRLPVPEGAVVYTLSYIYECKFDYDCKEFDAYKCEEDIHCEHQYKVYRVKETKFQKQMLAMLGKTVFLTKEEAEQALARMENG